MEQCMELYLVEYMDDTLLTSSVEASQGGKCGVHINLVYESTK
jgi:hypothetical protein